MNPCNTAASRTSVLALLLAISGTIALTPLPVLAADGEVRIAGQSVFAVPAGSGGAAADQAASTIQRNLDNALVAASDRSPSSVNIVYVGGVPVITLGGYQVATVDPDSATAAGSSPAVLAQRWADSLRQALGDQQSVSSYIAQLTGEAGKAAPDPGAGQLASAPPGRAYPADYPIYNQTPYPGGPGPYRGRVAYAPAGLTLQAVLRTSISTQAARSGDVVEAQLDQSVPLGDGSIPSGSVLEGLITEATPGRFLGRSGKLGIKFNRLRMPDGTEVPITAHVSGTIGKYKQLGSDQSGVVKGEGWGTKVGQLALRGGIGAGLGAGVGTAIGAIAGAGMPFHLGMGRAIGRGAWSGAAIGGGLGAADSLLLRKGKDVTIPSGQLLQVQLDGPATFGAGAPPYSGTF